MMHRTAVFVKRRSFGILLGALTYGSSALAYPEFQRAIQAESGRVVSCAMCHAHPDGPDGMKHGQIGSLGAAELKALNRARGMLEPGPLLDNPVLNPFGDYLLSELGRRRLLALKTQAGSLGAALDPRHDLDSDGIPDVRELRDGTDPADSRHGNPLLLFLANVRRYWFHLVMLSVATVLGLFSLSRLFSWFAHESERVIGVKGQPARASDRQASFGSKP